HRRRAGGDQTLRGVGGGLHDVGRPLAPFAFDGGAGQGDAVPAGRPEGRRPPDGQGRDRLAQLLDRPAVEEAQLPRQLPLVDQPDGAVPPLDRPRNGIRRRFAHSRPPKWARAAARSGAERPAAATARTASMPVAKALTMMAVAPAATAAAARSTSVSTGPETLAAYSTGRSSEPRTSATRDTRSRSGHQSGSASSSSSLIRSQ